VFTEVYSEKQWGSGAEEFDSGAGSGSDEIVDPYIAAIAAIGSREGFESLTFVDLGCGDFRVGRRLVPLCRAYVGVDVVPAVVDRNTRMFGSEAVRFEHRDIVADPLPDGDVCFVRQVFQHLSNAQIAQVLPKLNRYRLVFVTEHQPSPGHLRAPNLDKVVGPDIRLYDGSGVYLDQPPFGIPRSALSEVVTVTSGSMGADVDRGVIRTMLLQPENY
jgi:SAM-dependent methyltransferase